MSRILNTHYTYMFWIRTLKLLQVSELWGNGLPFCNQWSCLMPPGCIQEIGWFVTVGLWNATRFGFNFGNSIIVEKTVNAQLRHDISMRSPIVLVSFFSHEHVAIQMHWGHLLDLVVGPGCAMAFTPPWWIGCLGTKPRTIRWCALEADWLRSVMWFGLWNLEI